MNPLSFRAADAAEGWLRGRPRLARFLAGRHGELAKLPGVAPGGDGGMADHAVLCGYGRVGSILGELLRERGSKYVVIEQRRPLVEELRREGVAALCGDAASSVLLEHAHLDTARVLLVALGDPVATHLIVHHARRARPELPIIVRVTHESERERLLALGRVEPVAGEVEAALEMARHLLRRFGAGALETEAAIADVRSARGYGEGESRTRLIEVPVPAHAAVVGRRIADLGLPESALIVLLRRKKEFVVAKGATVLGAGDSLLAVADDEGIERLRAIVGEPAREDGPAGSGAQ